MTVKIPCYIQFTNNGRYMKIVQKSNTVIAELLVDGPALKDRAIAAYDHLGLMQLSAAARNKVYLGEISEIEDIMELEEEITELQKITVDVSDFRVVLRSQEKDF